MGTVYISELACKPLLKWLDESGEQVKLIDGEGFMADPKIRTHADLYYCQTGLAENAGVWEAAPGSIRAPYPGDAICNAVATGHFFVHNTKITSPQLLNKARELGLTVVHVAQGYSRCSCLPVDDRSFITADRGMARALENAGAQVLVISRGSVALRGYDYGFIGGCAGNITVLGRQTIVFNGDITRHPDWEAMRLFISCRNIDIKYFEDERLEDIGSILQSVK